MKFLSFVLLFILILSFSSCKTNQFNKACQRHGRWEFADTLGTQVYKYGGRYKDGIECGKWKYYLGGKIARKEKYRKNISYNQFFHENGKVSSQGKSQLDVSAAEIHWFYFGDWEYFDENGRPTMVKTFENGKQVNLRKIQLAEDKKN
ncbi:hypothetical protein [Adhaeribacter terreus]|uniref:MORN repeat variant n=1 Tax=Adhaeribacter terreus TaxID=529703 RepID=A0ABW0EBN4_9BACT